MVFSAEIVYNNSDHVSTNISSFMTRVAASDWKSDGSIFGRKSDPIAGAKAKIFEKSIRFNPIKQYVSLIGLKRIGSNAIFDFFRRIGSDSFLFFVESENKNCFRSDPMATLFMTYTEKDFKFIEKIRSAKNNYEIPAVKKKIKTIFDIKKNLEAN